MDFIEEFSADSFSIPDLVSPLQYLKFSSLAMTNTTSTGTSGFSKGDFEKIHDGLSQWNTSVFRAFGDMLYLVASDIMLGSYVRSSFSGVGKFNLKESDSAEQIVEKILGSFPTTFRISDIDPNTDSNSVLMKILPKDQDRGSSSPGKVSGFQYSSYELPQGDYALRTGSPTFLMR